MSKQNGEIDKKPILNKIFSACDTLRHVMDPSEYKDYVLTFLFLKYISDLYEDKRQRYLEKYKGDNERVKRQLERELFILEEECTFGYIAKHKEGLKIKEGKAEKIIGIGELINNALYKIQELNFEKLNNVFRGIDFNSEVKLGSPKQKKERLVHLINDFQDVDFRPYLDKIDIVGDVYEYLIEQFAADAGKKGGEFFTPSGVSTLVAKLAQPKAGDKIYDPTMGSGSLLIKAAKNVGSNNYALYGQEINGTTWALAKMNMFLHGIENVQLKQDDTIKAPGFLENNTIQKFNKVVANPPFSKDKWGYEEVLNDRYRRFERGLPPKTKGDYAFISHMVESLLPNGTAVIVVPHGVLFRGGSEGKIRQALIEENLIDAVIGLPPNLFFGTTISAALLVIKKNRKEKNVFFIDASKEFQEGKKQNKLRESDIEKIFKIFSEKANIEKYSDQVSPKKIKENDYNLNISRYVDTFEKEQEIDINAFQKKIVQLEKELLNVQGEMKKYLKELGYDT